MIQRNGASPSLCSLLQFTLKIHLPVKFSSCNLLCFAGERGDSGYCWIGLLAARQCSVPLSSSCLSWSHGCLSSHQPPVEPRSSARPQPPASHPASDGQHPVRGPSRALEAQGGPAQPLLAPVGLGSFSQLVLLRLGKQSC